MRRVSATAVQARGRWLQWSTATGFIVVAVFGSACEWEGATASLDDGAARDSAGIVIVHSESPDRIVTPRPELISDLVPPDSALTPVPWGMSVDPATGRVFAVDWSAPRVAVFDSTGIFIQNLGRAGSGPGEFRNPVAITLAPDGSLAVWDAGRAVISRWSVAGELIGEESAPVQYWGPGFAIAGKEVITVITEQGPAGNTLAQRLIATSQNGTRTIHEFTVELGVMQVGGSAMPAPKVLSPSQIWAADGERIYVLHGPEYRIDVYEKGELISSIRRDVGPVQVSRAAAIAAVEAGPGPYGSFMRRAGLTSEHIVSSVGYEEQVSPIQAINVAPDGRLWVTRTRDGLRPAFIDILTPEGVYEGTFTAPGITSAILSPTTFLAIRIEESTGLSQLGLYRTNHSSTD